MAFYKMQIKAHNNTTHHILKNEVDLILPKFPKGLSTIITGFIGLGFEGISSFLHNIKQLKPCQFKQIYRETNLCI